MKAACLIVLSLAVLAAAGPASFNRNNNKNEIDTNNKLHLQQQQHSNQYGEVKQTQAVELLKQWCFASQMSQPELTVSFKKLVGLVKSSPIDDQTEAAVMSERICQGALVQKTAHSGETIASQSGPDAQAHELIKDVYMDAMIACESRECMQQLLKVIQGQKVDTIRAAYYMTRMAVAEKDSIKDEQDVKQWTESLIKIDQQQPEAIERQKLFATTSIVGKFMKNKCDRKEQIVGELKQSVEQVAKIIIERYIRPVSVSEIQQYKQQQQPSKQLVQKIAKRNAALKALANIPGCVLSEIPEVEQVCVELALNKQELVTVRQSAIECLQHNDKVYRQLKQITFEQEEPIEVRVAALRTLMTVVWAGKEQQEQEKQQIATEIVEQLVKHCEEQRNQQQDDQFVLYAISYLDNLRTSQKPEHQAIRDCISKNKQHYMQIQLLCKKFKQQLTDIRRSSRNYKLEQEFNQIDSGLVLEGDIVYESKQKQQQDTLLPKLVRVNMSMPIMGETVNVVEITLRQNQMDEELLGALKMTKFDSESISKVVDTFKSSVEQKRSNQNQKQAEADLTIKVDGCTVVYVCAEDFKYTTEKRNTRSVNSFGAIVEELLEQLKRKPINFNRGFNVNFNERLAKTLDIDANIIAGLRFNSRASGQLNKDFEIVAQVEPRFAFEAIVGPAKMTSKKLLQRLSTKTAVGLRFRYKNDELVDVQVDLPMNTMELFTFETQLVEKSQTVTTYPYEYTYLPESIYGQEDIYAPEEELLSGEYKRMISGVRKMKRSIFESSNKKSGIAKFISGKQSYSRKIAYEMETSEKVARLSGLRGKLRFVASPKDMSFFVQAICQKYEPQMQGYRFKIERVQRGIEQQQILLTVSTPGSRFDRTMQIRSIVQTSQQRTLVKTDLQSPVLSTRFQLELVHDGRQYAVKVEAVEGQTQKWRHNFECGVQRNSQSQTGRIATTYKPYLNIQSTFLRRPIQMQGVVSYQQQPKTVISWEMKCPTSGDFVQGKFIVDQKDNVYGKRVSFRRSMRSPMEMIFERDLTLTGEIVAQINQHVVKVHKMIDFEAQKYSVNGEMTVSHKDMKRGHENQVVCQLKLNKEQQMVLVQRKCPQQAHKEFRFNVVSDYKIPQQHQLVAEYRYNTRRGNNQLVVYKHKVDVAELSSRKVQLQYQIELLANEYQIDEKIQGRTEAIFERRQKTLRTEMSSRDKQCKLVVDFESLEKHQIELFVESKQHQLVHKTTIRADQRQFTCHCATQKRGQMIGKFDIELLKQENECQIVLELPYQPIRCVVDLKLNSGKTSSWAIQTGRFNSKAEFTFDLIKMQKRNFLRQPFQSMLPFQSLKFKTDLKDLLKQDSYWMDTTFDEQDKSYFRFDSPIYRTDVEYDPRDWSSKIGMFARSKRSIGSNLYSNDESILNQVFDFNHLKHQNNKGMNLLGDKLWMVRTLINPSNSIEGMKQQMKRALFEYADRRQQQKHQFNWQPTEQRITFNMEHLPTGSEYSRFGGDLTTKYLSNWMNQPSKIYEDSYPVSKLNMESELIDFDLDFKPFDGEETYAKFNALSRLPRSSGFKKHESEFKYNKKHGYKAQMKHQDKHDQRHQWELETDEEPKKYTKMSAESDKYGKAHYEHNWRKYVTKRSDKKDQDEMDAEFDLDNQFRFDQEHQFDSKKRYDGEDDVFANRVKFFAESPRSKYSHKTDFAWMEPMKMVEGRFRRDVDSQLLVSDLKQSRYNTYDYLKHISARLNSQINKDQQQLYKLDFDYKPQQQLARLNVNMPNELLHSTSFEYKPTESLYKLQSKLMDQRNKQAHYELMASTKPVVSGLATAEQEPVFFNDQHPMLERDIYTKRSMLNQLFKQPLKLDYTDKFGRVARLDYDLVPEQQLNLNSNDKYFGLRQKRAAIYYKDDSRDFEHESSFDFYPEPLLAGGFKKEHSMKQWNQQQQQSVGNFATKISTKYGPVVVRVESDANTCQCQVESPIVNFKLTGESSTPMKRGLNLYKLQLDNKQQRVQLAKIVRKTVLGEFEPIVRLAHKIDSGRFEHQTELLVSIVDAIFKLKSTTQHNQRQVMVVEGEYNKQQEKLVVKLDGVRTSGQLVCDLVTGSAQLVLSVDDKRTLHHQTRLVRLNDKFYTLESMTSHKQQPLFKLTGKISAEVFENPMHLITSRHHSSHLNASGDQISTFEAVVYEPQMYHIRGQYDCLKKEANFVFKNEEEKRVQMTTVKYDAPNMTIYVDARLNSQNEGKIYQWQSKFAIPGVYYPRHCRQQQSCQSEAIYSDKSGVYSAKYQPGEYAMINTPYGKQYINLVY